MSIGYLKSNYADGDRLSYDAATGLCRGYTKWDGLSHVLCTVATYRQVCINICPILLVGCRIRLLVSSCFHTGPVGSTLGCPPWTIPNFHPSHYKAGCKEDMTTFLPKATCRRQPICGHIGLDATGPPGQSMFASSVHIGMIRTLSVVSSEHALISDPYFLLPAPIHAACLLPLRQPPRPGFLSQAGCRC